MKTRSLGSVRDVHAVVDDVADDLQDDIDDPASSGTSGSDDGVVPVDQEGRRH